MCRSRSALTDRLKLDRVPDDTTRAIDRIFDFVDRGVDVADRVLNRGKQTEELLQQTKRRGARREVIDASSDAPKAECAPVPVAKPHFYIVEATDPNSGHTIFVVTDGRNARTECSTREFANQILRALEKSSPGGAR